jgi:hypothetical protein
MVLPFGRGQDLRPYLRHPLSARGRPAQCRTPARVEGAVWPPALARYMRRQFSMIAVAGCMDADMPDVRGMPAGR